MEINQSINEFYEGIINLLLKDSQKGLPFADKLKIVSKNKSTKEISINANNLKDSTEFDNHMTMIYTGAIDLQLIPNGEERKKFFEDVNTFLIRLAYKASKILPFSNDLLEKISSIFPPTFHERHLLDLGRSYPNILPGDSYQNFYEEVQIFQSNLGSLNRLYNQYQQNITTFYCDEAIKKKYGHITALATTLLIFLHSSAEAERLFSQLYLTKTQKRGNLEGGTLEGLLLQAPET